MGLWQLVHHGTEEAERHVRPLKFVDETSFKIKIMPPGTKTRRDELYFKSIDLLYLENEKYHCNLGDVVSWWLSE
jgi:hypothetical protein